MIIKGFINAFNASVIHLNSRKTSLTVIKHLNKENITLIFIMFSFFPGIHATSF